ncbi:ABC transporter ATP-binding protein [Natronobiforma cellulositropha]|uniref:ABC transporter ATP-binding protein n=1 Tax=Natronobiforma cellulositropha TaxID=1679076 RepID=UPI0021D5FA05|nr:ABC transporter ATP-binding protein [Natronobiforma cellulositropha]
MTGESRTDGTSDETIPAIEFDGVTKEFTGRTAIDGVSIAVRPGEIYGLLGPNGAGKTTAIGVLLNVLRPTEGSARVFGHDSQTDELAVARVTGSLPEGFTPYDTLTGREHLEFVCGVREDDTPPGEYLERVDLADAADQRAGTYSRGMTRRLGLAMALVGDPDVLVLDEPFAGLDPTSAQLVRSLVCEQRAGGSTVLFSSHQLAHVQELCDRVGILSAGTLVDEHILSETARISITTDPPLSDVPREILECDGVTEATLESERLVVECERARDRGVVVSTIVEAGYAVLDIDTEGVSLEETFTDVVDRDVDPSTS